MSGQFTNSMDLPISVAAWLALDTYKANDERVSATQLLKPTRKLILENAMKSDTTLIPKLADVMSMMKSRKGTAVHNSIEQTWLIKENREKALAALGYSPSSIAKFVVNVEPEDLKPGQIPVYTERECAAELDGYEIGGTADFIIKGRLSDFKNTSTYSYVDPVKDKNYSLQGSVYRWAMPHIVTDDTMDIIEMYDDWTAAKSYQNNYPPQPIMVKRIPLLNLKATERYIRTKLKEVTSSLALPIEQLPFCTDEDLWRRADTFKYYKNPTATGRSTNNFDTYADAQKKHREDGSVGRIDIVKGKAVACRFCAAINICNQAKILRNNGELDI